MKKVKFPNMAPIQVGAAVIVKDNKTKNQEELDDVEGFLHIHTLPLEKRKQVIEQLRKKK